MTQLPPASLLRLKEGDVVRLCGLVAAANGLEAVARHEVREACRAGARFDAVVGDAPGCRVSLEITGEAAPALVSWRCSCDRSPPGSSDAGVAGQLGCMHVAAVLTAWIRAPADFLVPAPEAETPDHDAAGTGANTPSPASDTPSGRAPPPRLEQPRLLESGAPRVRGAARHTLAEELARLSSVEVVAAARRVLGVEPDEHEARALLAATLADPRRLASLVERLDPDARVLLGDMVLLGGAITAADLEARAQRTGRAASAARAEVAVLERHALVFRGAGPSADRHAGADRSFRQVAGWRVPPETRRALGSLWAPPPLASPEHHGPPVVAAALPRANAPHEGDSAAREPSRRDVASRVVRCSPRLLAQALALLARAPAPYNPFAPPRHERVAAQATSPSASHGRRERPTYPLTAADLAPTVLAEFARGANVPPGCARLARRVLLWARESGSDGRLLDLPAVPVEERALALRTGFRAWRAAEEPAELADLNAANLPVRVRFDTSHTALRPAALAAEAAEARGFLLRLLEGLAPGSWYALDDLLGLVWRANPLFLRGRQLTYTTPAWWIERVADARPLRPLRRDEWMAAEGVYIRELLAGPLSWWGAVDLALDAARAPVAFRLTPFGAYLMGAHDTGDAALGASPPTGEWDAAVLLTRERGLAVQPLAASAALLGALERWAEVSTVAGGRLVYTLTPGRAAAAFDSSATYDGLLRALRAAPAGGARVAAAVETRLSDWRQTYGASRIECDGTLIEAEDEAVLTEALAYAPEIAARCRRLAPALALASPDDGAALRDILKRRGYHL